MAITRNRVKSLAASGDMLHQPHVEALRNLRILIRAAQRHSSKIEKHCGVTGAQLWVLQELHEKPGMRVGEIAKKLVIHQTTASNLLDALVKKNCIDKLRDPTDHRVVKLVLSKQGISVLKHGPKPARGLLPEALQKLDEDRLLELNKGLQALMQVIDFADESYGLKPLPFTM